MACLISGKPEEMNQLDKNKMRLKQSRYKCLQNAVATFYLGAQAFTADSRKRSHLSVENSFPLFIWTWLASVTHEMRWILDFIHFFLDDNYAAQILELIARFKPIQLVIWVLFYSAETNAGIALNVLIRSKFNGAWVVGL
jgi:membrane protein insertase Oxa1/YidC/SpoIIIJ